MLFRQNLFADDKTNISIKIAGFLLVVLFLLSIWIRLPLIRYNLPVVAHPDERISLDILYNISQNGLNPANFEYPSFYYYINYLLIQPTNDLGRTLLWGRVINVVIAGILALITFIFSKKLLDSNLSALIAGGLCLFSPIIARNGSYIITDILLTTLMILSLYCLYRFFESGNYWAWLLGMMGIGLAISSKYTALILIPLYLLAELLFVVPDVNKMPANHKWQKTAKWENAGKQT